MRHLPFVWLIWALLGGVAAAVPSARGLELYRERGGATDLAVLGLLKGVPAGESRFVRWAELRALPVEKLKLTGEFLPGEQEVTVLFLAELWKVLPLARSADTLLARCDDGYASVYRETFIQKERPFLVLEINGLGPEKWPPAGMAFNPGPYVIMVSDVVTPGVGRLLDVNHKKPWGVSSLEVANFAQSFRDAYSGNWAHLSERGQRGREIWVNSCASCHSGPGKIFGGTKSGQPFAVVDAIAAQNPEFFSLYVRDPKKANSAAKMEPHPHYSDTQMAELRAFIGAEK